MSRHPFVDDSPTSPVVVPRIAVVGAPCLIAALTFVVWFLLWAAPTPELWTKEIKGLQMDSHEVLLRGSRGSGGAGIEAQDLSQNINSFKDALNGELASTLVVASHGLLQSFVDAIAATLQSSACNLTFQSPVSDIERCLVAANATLGTAVSMPDGGVRCQVHPLTAGSGLGYLPLTVAGTIDNWGWLERSADFSDLANTFLFCGPKLLSAADDCSAVTLSTFDVVTSVQRDVGTLKLVCEMSIDAAEQYWNQLTVLSAFAETKALSVHLRSEGSLVASYNDTLRSVSFVNATLNQSLYKETLSWLPEWTPFDIMLSTNATLNLSAVLRIEQDGQLRSGKFTRPSCLRHSSSSVTGFYLSTFVVTAFVAGVLAVVAHLLHLGPRLWSVLFLSEEEQELWAKYWISPPKTASAEQTKSSQYTPALAQGGRQGQTPVTVRELRDAEAEFFEDDDEMDQRGASHAPAQLANVDGQGNNISLNGDSDVDGNRSEKDDDGLGASDDSIDDKEDQPAALFNTNFHQSNSGHRAGRPGDKAKASGPVGADQSISTSTSVHSGTQQARQSNADQIAGAPVQVTGTVAYVFYDGFQQLSDSDATEAERISGDFLSDIASMVKALDGFVVFLDPFSITAAWNVAIPQQSHQQTAIRFLEAVRQRFVQQPIFTVLTSGELFVSKQTNPPTVFGNTISKVLSLSVLQCALRLRSLLTEEMVFVMADQGRGKVMPCDVVSLDSQTPLTSLMLYTMDLPLTTPPMNARAVENAANLARRLFVLMKESQPIAANGLLSEISDEAQKAQLQAILDFYGSPQGSERFQRSQGYRRAALMWFSPSDFFVSETASPRLGPDTFVLGNSQVGSGPAGSSVLAKFAKVKHGIRFGGSSSIAPGEKREGSLSIDGKDGLQEQPPKQGSPEPVVAPVKEPLRIGSIVIHAVKSEYELLPLKFSDQLHRVWNVATTKVIGKGKHTTMFPGLGEDGSLGTIQVADVTKIPPSALQLLTHGASVAASIRHRHSVEVYSVTIANDRWLMMASESLPGQSLRTLMTDFTQGSTDGKLPVGGRQLPLHPIRRYAKEMVDILRFLQSNKIVHGALSPSNLLLGSDGSIKLGNYSRSQLLAADSSSSWLKSNDKDRSTSLSAIKESTSSFQSTGSGQRTPGHVSIDITLEAVREGINAEKEVADEYYFVSPEFLQAIEQVEPKMAFTPHGPLEDSGRDQGSASFPSQTLFQVVQSSQEDTQTTDKDSTVVDSRNSSSSETDPPDEGPVKDSLGELRLVDNGTPLTASRAGLTSSAEQQTPQLPTITNPIHPNTDIYGFGRTLLYLLLGSLPDRKISKKEVESLLRESPRFSQIQLSATASTSVSGAKSEAATFTSLCSLIEMCLSENPRHRPSADQIAHHPFFV